MCKFDPLFPIFKKGYYPINDVRVNVVGLQLTKLKKDAQSPTLKHKWEISILKSFNQVINIACVDRMER